MRRSKHFARIFHRVFEKSNTRSRKKSNAFFHAKIMEYIFNHLSEKLTLQQLSAKVGINKLTLGTIFKEKTGVNFVDFVNNVRVERARVLLKENDLSVTEIAYECGFGCVRSFNRAFSKRLNISPSEYRKTVLQNRHS